MQQEKGNNIVVIKEKKSITFVIIKFVILFLIFVGVFMFFKSPSGNMQSHYETSSEIYNHYFHQMKMERIEEQKNKKNKPVLQTYSKRMFLIDFNGGVAGNEVELLKRNIDYVLINAKPNDEVAIRLYSPGGSVTAYGLAASEINRLKDAGLHITTLVDQVAASGGYMMAVVSDHIIAAPFSFIGSIGVVAQVPIYEDFLKKVGVEYKLYTAGDNKRNVVSVIKPTESDEEKMKESISKIHQQFKNHVKKYRPQIDIEAIANGDVFSGQESFEKKLIDEISTSSDFLFKRNNSNYQIVYVYTEETESNSITGMATVDAIIDSIKTSVVKELKEELSSKYENILVK